MALSDAYAKYFCRLGGPKDRNVLARSRSGRTLPSKLGATEWGDPAMLRAMEQSSIALRTRPRRVHLAYEVERLCDDWTLPEETVPESRPHDLTLDLLKTLLAAWASPNWKLRSQNDR